MIILLVADILDSILEKKTRLSMVGSTLALNLVQTHTHTHTKKSKLPPSPGISVLITMAVAKICYWGAKATMRRRRKKTQICIINNEKQRFCTLCTCIF